MNKEMWCGERGKRERERERFGGRICLSKVDTHAMHLNELNLNQVYLLSLTPPIGIKLALFTIF